MTSRGELLIAGTAASAGVAVGPAVVVDTVRSAAAGDAVPPLDDSEPIAALRAAIADAARQLRSLRDAARAAERTEAADVLEAQALMAEDPMLVDAATAALRNGASLGAALVSAAEEISGLLASIDDPYIAARSADVVEVADRVRQRLAGLDSPDLGSIETPSVLVATALTAADTAVLDPEKVLGIVTEAGGPTSHVAIIARSLGVAAVVAANGVVAGVRTGDTAAIDGATGEVAIRPRPATVADFAARRAAAEAAVVAAEQFRGVSIALDGRPIQVPANVGSRDDLERAVAVGAEGVGLLRTEFLFLDRAEPPSEDEQADFYSFAASAFSEPVVIRTFDIGGDKPAPYLDVATEDNPFLGVRGARLYRRHPETFAAQVRAILRAAAAGEVHLMLPMVSTVEEIAALRRIIEGQARQLDAQGKPHALPPVGVMVEVPSVALTADRFANCVDFFSIGTNDLTQYAMAADRTHALLDGLQDPLHPAVLALCALTVASAQRHGIGVSVCGLAAADPLGAAVLAAMGVGKLSVDARQVNAIKSVIASMDAAATSGMVDAALQAATAADVRRIVGAALGCT
ncbi:phosphoenolpyruvate--protein phosphotransferase [Candidatus Poriferisodalis sp.]|uniref:phosphoenolpyruvate--protein phosphotransferase n=1 Tax=Candidatus Poriferisodalis sp. TaxID=3101277 RepID=UPI003B02E204